MKLENEKRMKLNKPNNIKQPKYNIILAQASIHATMSAGIEFVSIRCNSMVKWFFSDINIDFRTSMFEKQPTNIKHVAVNIG